VVPPPPASPPPPPLAGPPPLPVAGQPPERSDAAANRERILCAARRLLADQGADGLSMNAVAAAAGVGKGTIFRRFGDRDGLTRALLDAHTIELQNAFLSGPPPLGPGAPPRERLESFLRALVAFQLAHLEIVLAAERVVTDAPPVYGTFLLHLRTLLEQLDPRLDAPVLGEMLLSAVAPASLQRQLAREGADPERIAAAAVALAHGLTGC
jgi:AcrR family transcriptional regulator